MGKECTYHAYFTSRVSKVDILKPDGIKLQSLMGKKKKERQRRDGRFKIIQNFGLQCTFFAFVFIDGKIIQK